jgi:hypothetical protein
MIRVSRVVEVEAQHLLLPLGLEERRAFIAGLCVKLHALHPDL